MMKRSSVVAQSVFPVSGEASRTASRCRTLAASVFAIVSFVCFSGLCRPAIGQAVSKDQLATLGEARVRRHVDAVPRNECFPVESLPESSRRLSQQLLLDALDSEALYTFVGDLKPISEGFFRTWFQLEPVDTQELESVRAAMSSWKCGDCYDAGVLPFQNSRGGERYASGWIASRSAVREKLKQHAEFFGRLGMTVDSDAESLLLRIEGADQPGERWRGFGLLFGYPKRAVDFFVRAGMHHATTGEFVERDFRNFPTHSGSSGRFVYAVPRLTKESAGELKVRRMVEAILTQYRQRRAKYVIDESSNRVAELIRDWFDDGSGWCHPDHAMQKAVAWDVARTWVEEKSIPLKTVRPSDSLEDLQQLAPLFDAPRIIAMGESTHGTREFFQLKHRLFRYLVENHGVRLFGLEASYAACLPINNYIVSGDGDPRAAIKGQGFWTWDTEEVLALVEWMRAWNESRDPTTEPLRFYGFDTQDAYTPLNAVLTELAEHSPDVADQFRKRFAIALDEQYGGKWNDATRAQLDDLLISAKELRSVCEGINNRSAADRGRHRLLLQQATAAIAGRRANLDHWSSLGRVKEVELYDRIRSGLPQIESFVTSLTGPEAQTLLQLVR
ncbi:MAG: erythromycin esterase family protein, partial [Planctomycetota bacterium]